MYCTIRMIKLQDVFGAEELAKKYTPVERTTIYSYMTNKQKIALVVEAKEGIVGILLAKIVPLSLSGNVNALSISSLIVKDTHRGAGNARSMIYLACEIKSCDRFNFEMEDCEELDLARLEASGFEVTKVGSKIKAGKLRTGKD